MKRNSTLRKKYTFKSLEERAKRVERMRKIGSTPKDYKCFKCERALQSVSFISPEIFLWICDECKNKMNIAKSY